MNTTININEFGGVIVGLLLVGAIFKNAFPSFPNRLIPLLTWILGVLSYLALTKGWTDSQQWIAAIIAAASATGIHSGIKNTMEKDDTTPPKLPLLLIGALLALSVPTMTGCATTTPPQAVVYHTLQDTQIAVDKAMRFYGSQCALGKVSVEKQEQVDLIHDQYRAGFRIAVTTARFDYKAITPDSLQQLTSDLLILISRL